MPMFWVIELRQLVGATTMAKGLSSHQIIKNAAKEEILVIVTLEDDADVDSGNAHGDGCERASNTNNDAESHDDVIDLLHGRQCYLYQYGVGNTVLVIRYCQYGIVTTNRILQLILLSSRPAVAVLLWALVWKMAKG